MKWKFTLSVFLFTSSFVAGQVTNYTYDDSKEVIPGYQYGKFVMKMPFGAKLYENHFIKAQELLDNIKGLCKGKAIFFDFWDPWCPPCISEMPDNRILYNETKNLPVEFIYICTDARTTKDNWITKVSVLKQPGIHIFVQDEIIRELWKLLPTYGGFPTYLFFDTKGEFKPGAIPLNSGTTKERLIESIKK